MGHIEDRDHLAGLWILDVTRSRSCSPTHEGGSMLRGVDPARRPGASGGLRLLAAVSMLAAVAVASVVASSAAAARAKAPTEAQACGTKPVTMQGYFETGFPDVVDL